MKNNNLLIIMMGLTATGKSSTSNWIANELDADIYHSAVIRNDLGYNFSLNEAEGDFFTYENNNRLVMDQLVYDEMLNKAVFSFENRRNVILDAGHFFYNQRKNIYNKIKSFNLDKIILNTVCNETIVKMRLKKRIQNFSTNPLDETPSFKAYQSAKKIIQYPDKYEIEEKISNLFRLDTNTGRLININDKDFNNNTKLIFKLLKTYR